MSAARIHDLMTDAQEQCTVPAYLSPADVLEMLREMSAWVDPSPESTVAMMAGPLVVTIFGVRYRLNTWRNLYVYAPRESKP